MSGTFRSLGLAVTMTAALAVAAAAAPHASNQSTPAQPAKSGKPAMGSHSVSGTLEKFDSSGNMLTVKTSSGTEILTLGSDAKIHMGSRTLTAADLSSHSGSKVRVHYTESNGQKTAQDVSLSAGSSSKPSKKPGL